MKPVNEAAMAATERLGRGLWPQRGWHTAIHLSGFAIMRRIRFYGAPNSSRRCSALVCCP